MSGTSLINLYPNIGVKKDSTKLCGLYSAQYSLSRSIKSIYASGRSVPVAKYAELPNVELSYSQYLDAAGNFDPNEFNSESKLELIIRDSTIVCDKAVLSRLSYAFNVDGPFLVTKTYIGYTKSAPSSGSPNCTGSAPRVFKRQDFRGSIPPGIDAEALTSVVVDINVNRETIPEFATRKPYGVYVSFPVTTSIRYEAYTKGADSYVLDMMKNACGDPDMGSYTLSANACGVGITVKNAFLTELSYSGADAAKGSNPQIVSVTFTSFETYPGIKPVVLFSDS